MFPRLRTVSGLLSEPTNHTQPTHSLVFFSFSKNSVVPTPDQKRCNNKRVPYPTIMRTTLDVRRLHNSTARSGSTIRTSCFPPSLCCCALSEAPSTPHPTPPHVLPVPTLLLSPFFPHPPPSLLVFHSSCPVGGGSIRVRSPPATKAKPPRIITLTLVFQPLLTTPHSPHFP